MAARQRHLSMAAKLREGFTTGSAATGAALAALHLLRFGLAPGHVDVPLPPFDTQSAPRPVPVEHKAPASGSATQTLHPRAWLRLAVAACAPGPAPELAGLTELAELAGLAQFPAALPPDTAEAAAARAPLRLAHASIRKDGGDDPDATSGALITATIIIEDPLLAHACAPDPAGIAHSPACPALMPLTGQTPPTNPATCANVDMRTDLGMCANLSIHIEGGPGVGRVTLPGLPVAVGEAAINPVPRQQIAFALRHALASAQSPCPPLRVIISVPEGRRLARQTFNPRLGIVGGISILGTQGTVRPYSHQAWKATIQQGLAVAAATGCRSIALTTGRRSERLLMERYPHMPPQCFIQVADFAAFSLEAAGAGSFDNLVWGCFFGKLVKLAQGHAYTHARHADLDMTDLARVCEQYGAHCAAQVKNCVTAAHALELLLQDKAGADVMQQVAVKAAAVAAKFAGRPVRLHLFHTDGRELLAL